MSIEIKGPSYYAVWIGGSLSDAGAIELLQKLGWTATWLTNPCAEIDPPLDELDKSRYPHSCPHCGSPAYVGMNDVDCMRGCK